MKYLCLRDIPVDAVTRIRAGATVRLASRQPNDGQAYRGQTWHIIMDTPQGPVTYISHHASRGRDPVSRAVFTRSFGLEEITRRKVKVNQ